jgi:phage terminase large subunit-like protein
VNIVETMADAELFEPWFAGSSWSAWRVALKGAYALPMTKAERNVFRTIAGRESPRKPVRECWFVIGRRGGKDSIASLMGTYTAAFFDPRGKLRRGERASVLCLAVDREQAGIVLGYIKSYFAEIPYLKQMVTNETINGLELSNGVDIVVATNDYRSVRGRAVALAILDEVAYWRDDRSTAPDTETYNAIVPGTVTVGGMIIGISSPHRKSGLLYERWREHYGQKGDVLSSGHRR